MENNLHPPSGVAFGMPDEEYHGTHHISSGFLKTFNRSPAHAFAAYLDPNRERKDKKAWRIGRAWHCALFEPSHFGDRYASSHDAHPSTKQALLLNRMLDRTITADRLRVLPDGLSLTTKEGKALVAEIEAAGQAPVTPEQFEFVCKWFPRLDCRDVLPEDAITGVLRMAEIARKLPVSRVIFDQFGAFGAAEVSMFTDNFMGLPCRIRADYMLAPCAAFPDGLIVDGKSTTDASPDGFGRQVWNLDYGLQAAFYTQVFKSVWRTPGRPKFVWLAQEKEEPFAAKFYGAGQDLMDHWDRKLRDLMPRVQACLSDGRWPAYGDDVQDLQLPGWALRRMEDAA